MDPQTLTTKPYDGQKPGTSGLRKKVTVFQQEDYLANFVQALFNSLPVNERVGQTLLVSGDGRYWNDVAINIIAGIAAANGFSRLWVGQNGWVSTPAASCIIRNRENGICTGGILLTASHNPGGPTEDFGVKYNCANGGPAPEGLTNKMYEETLRICEYKTVKLPELDIKKLGRTEFELKTGKFVVEVIDPVEDWLALMRTVFNFELLRDLIAHPKFSFVYDGLNGIGGPYAQALFVKELGADPKSLIQCQPLPDFGQCHPDPNLTYAKQLVDIMRVKEPETVDPSTPIFGAAGDGDCDRNMILGRGWFVTPSDSVAIITAYAQQCIPYFSKGLKGVARSMPTSLALKAVADKMKIPHYEVPTGWKFFGNLMDADKCSICGEESFGTGSDHIREKDGLWAVLAWMSVLALRNQKSENRYPEDFVSVTRINQEFWKEFGRNYYTRYDYENVDSAAANKVMETAATIDKSAITNNPDIKESTRQFLRATAIADVNQFCYKDPVDGSVSPNQGVRVYFADGSRFVLRLSGTGSSGATIRLYLEKSETDPSRINMQTAEAMEDLVTVALDLACIEKYTSRNHPTVIT